MLEFQSRESQLCTEWLMTPGQMPASPSRPTSAVLLGLLTWIRISQGPTVVWDLKPRAQGVLWLLGDSSTERTAGLHLSLFGDRDTEQAGGM